MEYNVNKIWAMRGALDMALLNMQEVYSEIATNIEVPSDSEFQQIDLGDVKKISVELDGGIRSLYDKINKLEEDINNTEKTNRIIADKIGERVEVHEGLKYYETGIGEGNSGVIGMDIRPEEAEYVVDRIAIYADGVLVANIGDTGTDIEECIIAYEKQYGNIEVSYAISMIGDNGAHNATGWLDRKQVAEGKLVGGNTSNLEEALLDIEKKYENYAIEAPKSVKDKPEFIEMEDSGIMAGIVSDLKKRKAEAAEKKPDPITIDVPRTDNTSQKRTAILEKKAGEYKTGDTINVDGKEYIVKEMIDSKWYSAHHAEIRITDNNGDEDSLMFDFSAGPDKEENSNKDDV